MGYCFQKFHELQRTSETAQRTTHERHVRHQTGQNAILTGSQVLRFRGLAAAGAGDGTGHSKLLRQLQNNSSAAHPVLLTANPTSPSHGHNVPCSKQCRDGHVTSRRPQKGNPITERAHAHPSYRAHGLGCRASRRAHACSRDLCQHGASALGACVLTCCFFLV